VAWPLGSRAGRSRPGWGGHPRRYRESWPETAAAHRYRAQTADAAAFSRAQRPKPAKLVLEPRLRAVVEAKLALRWSPQQIAGWLPLAIPRIR
jgi:IS30 family transposase